MDASALTDAAVARSHTVAFAELSEFEQLLVTIWGIEADVNNGGFDQYYFNSYGDQALLAPIALREIGAESMAVLVERANAVFGPAGPPAERNLRQKRLESVRGAAESLWSELDQQFWKYPDDIAFLLQKFIERRSNTSLERTRER